MTEKLYYADCHLAVFSARVLSCTPAENGFDILLDQTAFYPEGGGQPCDLGTLGDAAVLDVREAGDTVIHRCNRALSVGDRVEGRIDWSRRFDLMQQHSGEHIVSGCIHRRYGYHNVGFHMGADVITIDFDGPIPAEALPAIEDEVNAAIWRNTPLHIWYPSEAELPGVPYRTKRALPWPVRIVEFPGVDICACCGVHVAATGEIGLVKLLSCVKFHQGVRLELVCGGRAMALYRGIYDQNRQVGAAFSAKMLETGEAARRMSEALAAEKFRCTGLQHQLMDITAERYVNCNNVIHFDPALEGTRIRELADRIAARCSGFAAVFAGSDDTGYQYCIAARDGNLRPLAAAMARELSARGGGKPDFIQGRVTAGERAIRAFLETQSV